MAEIEVLLLGPVRLQVSGKEVAIPRPRVRALVALLAMDAPAVIGIEAMSDALWGERLPRDPTHTIHVYMSRLRSLHPTLAERVVTCHGGYQLAIDPECVDISRFEWLMAQARRDLGSDPQRAKQLLDAALALWRGRCFGSLHYAEFVSYEVLRLEELRLLATEDSFEADIRLGLARHAIPGLRQFAHEHPFRERGLQLLARALDAEGRATEAGLVFPVERMRTQASRAS